MCTPAERMRVRQGRSAPEGDEDIEIEEDLETEAAEAVEKRRRLSGPGSNRRQAQGAGEFQGQSSLMPCKGHPPTDSMTDVADDAGGVDAAAGARNRVEYEQADVARLDRKVWIMCQWFMAVVRLRSYAVFTCDVDPEGQGAGSSAIIHLQCDPHQC